MVVNLLNIRGVCKFLWLEVGAFEKCGWLVKCSSCVTIKQVKIYTIK